MVPKILHHLQFLIELTEEGEALLAAIIADVFEEFVVRDGGS